MTTKKDRFKKNLESSPQKRSAKLFRGPKRVWERLSALKKRRAAKSDNEMLIALINTVCDEEGIPQ